MGLLSNEVTCSFCNTQFKYIKGGIMYKPADGYLCMDCLSDAYRFRLIYQKKKGFLSLNKFKIVQNQKLTLNDIKSFQSVCEASKQLATSFHETIRSSGTNAYIVADEEQRLFYVHNADRSEGDGLIFRFDQIESFHENYEYTQEESSTILNNGNIMIELINSPVPFLCLHPNGAVASKVLGQKNEIHKQNMETLSVLTKITGKAPGSVTKEIDF